MQELTGEGIGRRLASPNIVPASTRTSPAGWGIVASGSLVRDPTRVTLPGGLTLDDGRCLSEAELRPLRGYEEDWLASHPGVPSVLATTQLLGSCLVSLGGVPGDCDLARRLLVGDRDFLMLQLRRITLGDQIGAVFVCPSCRAKMDVDLTIADVPVECRPGTASTHQIELASADGRPRSVRFRLPTGADQEAILGLDSEAAVEELLRRCLLDDAGADLSEEEHASIANAMGERAPGLNLELDLTCPECGEAFLAPFDTSAFFLDEMRIRGDQLLREVHALAFHYHWSESEILGLARARRRAYLSLLVDALRPD